MKKIEVFSEENNTKLLGWILVDDEYADVDIKRMMYSVGDDWYNENFWDDGEYVGDEEHEYLRDIEDPFSFSPSNLVDAINAKFGTDFEYEDAYYYNREVVGWITW